jgi:hypothetical protein
VRTVDGDAAWFLLSGFLGVGVVLIAVAGALS